MQGIHGCTGRLPADAAGSGLLHPGATSDSARSTQLWEAAAAGISMNIVEHWTTGVAVRADAAATPGARVGSIAGFRVAASETDSHPSGQETPQAGNVNIRRSTCQTVCFAASPFSTTITGCQLSILLEVADGFSTDTCTSWTKPVQEAQAQGLPTHWLSSVTLSTAASQGVYVMQGDACATILMGSYGAGKAVRQVSGPAALSVWWESISLSATLVGGDQLAGQQLDMGVPRAVTVTASAGLPCMWAAPGFGVRFPGLDLRVFKSTAAHARASHPHVAEDAVLLATELSFTSEQTAADASGSLPTPHAHSAAGGDPSLSASNHALQLQSLSFILRPADCDALLGAVRIVSQLPMLASRPTRHASAEPASTLTGEGGNFSVLLGSIVVRIFPGLSRHVSSSFSEPGSAGSGSLRDHAPGLCGRIAGLSYTSVSAEGLVRAALGGCSLAVSQPRGETDAATTDASRVFRCDAECQSLCALKYHG